MITHILATLTTLSTFALTSHVEEHPKGVTLISASSDSSTPFPRAFDTFAVYLKLVLALSLHIWCMMKVMIAVGKVLGGSYAADSIT